MPKNDQKMMLIGLGVALAVAVVVILILSMSKSKKSGGDAYSRAAPVRQPPAPQQQPQQPQKQEQSNPPTLVLFYADSCTHCRTFKPVWESMQGDLAKMGVKCLSIPHGQDTSEMMQKEGIAGFPTVKFYPGGFPGSQGFMFTGPRTKEGIIAFLQNGPPTHNGGQ